MLSAGRQLGQTRRGTRVLAPAGISPSGFFTLALTILFLLVSQGTAWPYDYRFLYNHCPGPEWSVMCRGCCEYDVIHCRCPLQGTPVGYAVPCCRNAHNECDPCIIHPECGGVLRKRQGHIVIESYPTNARCEWVLQVDRPFTIEFKFMMLSLEFDYSCRYDFVEVRDGDSMNSRVIGRFCGNERPPPITSSGNFLHILFVSDGYKNFDGFFATFQENSACSSSPCLHDGTCVLDSSQSYHCACLAGYTGRSCENVLMCGRPMVPIHGATQSLALHVGGHVIYRCDPGYRLQGLRISTCLLDGTWSNQPPQCVPVRERTCSVPPKVRNGDQFLAYGPGDVLIALQYFCYKPYKLVGNDQRTCLPNNTWSGAAPSCVKEPVTVPAPDDKKDKDTAEEKHPAGGKDKGTNGRTNKVEEKDYEQGKDTGKGKDIKVTILKDPRKGAGQNVSRETDERTNLIVEEDQSRENDLETGQDKDTKMDRVGPVVQEPSQGGQKNFTKESDYSNTVQEKDEKDLVNGLDKDVGLGKGTVILIKDHDAGKNMSKVDLDLTNTVEKKELDRQPGAGLDKDKTTKDLEHDNRKDIDFVLLKENGQNALIGTEYNIEREEAIHTLLPLQPKPEFNTSSNDLDSVLPTETRNSTDILRSNEIEGKMDGSVPQELDEKEYPSGGNVSQRTHAELDKGGKMERYSKPTDETRPTERTEEPEETGKETGTENQSFNEAERNMCPPPPRLYNGYYVPVPDPSYQTVEFFCNHSYALSGAALRRCQHDGTWSGSQPICLRACREPKVSVLVKQRVLPPHAQSRKTPVHRLYSGLVKLVSSPVPTKDPSALHQLPAGFHHLYTHIEYECTSPFYYHTGSSRRTCLKTGKWSGRHVSCSPVCGKIPSFDPQKPAEAHWPWLAAIYRRSAVGFGAKPAKAEGLPAAAGKATEDVTSLEGWQLVCSGALVNQRSVVAAAHCVTELGKLYPLDAAKIKVVLGKQFRSDQLQTKGLQHLRVSSIAVHPNYDPLLLDSDLAVLKLMDKARIGEHALPICLPEAQVEEERVVKQAVVTGWSLTQEPGAGGDEERVRVGRVQMGDVVQCERQYANNGVPISVSENMFCGRQRPDVSPSRICPADTGGILLQPAPTPVPSPTADSSILLLEERDSSERVWRLLGLVSFGYDQRECNPELFTVYTRVSNFRDFIENSMK
ncbi:inactive serine protease PAMR1 isoform X2 [Denticeps clupeoides]|uniref:Inactive serine protease PAMR1 n=1 Tax=Denticeps clupeoides TaxID=299321 RepID=A0AAY4B4Y2_9TELE|nr:inactive serine protease PAMR1-like isoform X2 [Denticeps clupeoides]